MIVHMSRKKRLTKVKESSAKTDDFHVFRPAMAESIIPSTSWPFEQQDARLDEPSKAKYVGSS